MEVIMQETGPIKLTNLQPQAQSSPVHYCYPLPLPRHAWVEIVKVEGQPCVMTYLHTIQDNTETQGGSVTTVVIRLMGFPGDQQLWLNCTALYE